VNCNSSKTRLVKLISAAGIYGCFAVYLFVPHFKRFDTIQYLLPFSICLGCLGCYVLSRRWIGAFAGSFFAGAVYGFGPFALSLAKFHPTVSFLAAAIPWLFLPAAAMKRKLRWLSIPLSALPFLAIILFFQAAKQYRLFPIPTQLKLNSGNLSGLLAPLVMADRSIILVSFYHVPIAALVMGFTMLFKARRFGIIIIITAGTILALCNSILDVSPIIWLAVAVLCCSIITGAGTQGLALAGYNDRKWILAIIITMGTLAIVTLLFATKYFEAFAGLGKEAAKLFTESAKLYILGAIAAAIIFFMTRAKTRAAYLRWAVLCSAMAVDIFLSARFVIDRFF